MRCSAAQAPGELMIEQTADLGKCALRDVSEAGRLVPVVAGNARGVGLSVSAWEGYA